MHLLYGRSMKLFEDRLRNLKTFRIQGNDIEEW